MLSSKLYTSVEDGLKYLFIDENNYLLLNFEERDYEPTHTERGRSNEQYWTEIDCQVLPKDNEEKVFPYIVHRTTDKVAVQINKTESIGIELTHIQGDLYKTPFYDETY